MQAALLIRREKHRLRGGRNVNFRELPSNFATRLIPPLPRYPPKSYANGVSPCGCGPGKAAWQNRMSPQPLTPSSPHSSRGEYNKTKQCEAHRRWMKRNRIRDASFCYGSSGEEEDEEGSSSMRRRGEVNAAVNTLLYAGLGTTALGLIISFVGTGEKGFLSPELRLIGPTLLCAGLLCCFLRIMLCLCLCRCGSCCWHVCQAKAAKSKEIGLEAAASKIMATTALLPQPSSTQPPQPHAYHQHHCRHHHHHHHHQHHCPLQHQYQEPLEKLRVQLPEIPEKKKEADAMSCSAPLSLTPSPSITPPPPLNAPSPTSTPSPPTLPKSKGGELLLCPSQLSE